MRVTALCGTSPLPVCQALKTLGATEVVLFHGPGQSTLAAERVKSYCEMHLNVGSVRLIEMPGFVPRDIDSILYKSQSLITHSDLVYGPGTTPMNVLTHSWWSTAEGNSERSAWYLASTPPKLHRSGGDEVKPIKSTGLDLTGLIQLNFDLTNAPPRVRRSKLNRFNDADLAVVGRGVVSSLYGDQKLSPTVEEILNNNNLRNTAPGNYLEIVAFQLLTRLARDIGGCEIYHSVKAVESNDEHKESVVLEVDVVVRKGDRLLIVSCGAFNRPPPQESGKSKKKKGTQTQRRLKYFEVVEQGQRLGGSEARTATLVVDRGLTDRDGAVAGALPRVKVIRRHRKSVGLPETPTLVERHVMVDLAELLGDTPEAALVRPRDHLVADAPGNWFVDWFDAYFKG